MALSSSQSSSSSSSTNAITITAKVINDPIHGQITIDPFALLIINNDKFQRLRHLKQLGVTYLVYPSATHTRFEHSIGTYHLARELALSLQKKQQEKKSKNPSAAQITNDEVTCVALAGLCHDLGHGPFSHLWEMAAKIMGVDYVHEEMSVKLFDAIVEESRDESLIKFMKEKCDVSEQHGDITHQQLIGRLIRGEWHKNRRFLYEIVCNERTGFDVDKWDYMNRDSYYVGLSNQFDTSRQIHMLEVKEFDGDSVLAMRDKQMFSYVQLLYRRRMNHYLCYKHAKCHGFELIVLDALKAGMDYLEKQEAPTNDYERDAKELLLNPTDIATITSLNDALLIHYLQRGCGEQARQLIARIDSRNMYTYVMTVRCALSVDCDDAGREEYKEILKTASKEIDAWNREADNGTVLQQVKLDYGCGLNHPLSAVCVYGKGSEVDEAQQVNPRDYIYSDLQIAKLHISLIRMFSKQDDAPTEETGKKFLKKFEKLGYVRTIE